MGDYEFNVKMSCGGCSKAIERALSKVDGISSYRADHATQIVVVKGDVPYDQVLARIEKTGKQVVSGRVVG